MINIIYGVTLDEVLKFIDKKRELLFLIFLIFSFVFVLFSLLDSGLIDVSKYKHYYTLKFYTFLLLDFFFLPNHNPTITVIPLYPHTSTRLFVTIF